MPRKLSITEKALLEHVGAQARRIAETEGLSTREVYAITAITERQIKDMYEGHNHRINSLIRFCDRLGYEFILVKREGEGKVKRTEEMQKKLEKFRLMALTYQQRRRNIENERDLTTLTKKEIDDKRNAKSRAVKRAKRDAAGNQPLQSLSQRRNVDDIGNENDFLGT